MTRISSAFHWTGLATGLLISLVMLAGCQPNPSDSESTDRPNIIFIFMDDQASHSISAYGSELVETPNMDRLANEGIRFDQAFVTNSICAPSRAVLLTGVHSHINGKMTNQDTFDGSQVTYPKLLREAGYQTAMIGKWHLRSLPTGYDHWDILPGQGAYYNPDFINEGGEYRVEGYVTDIITDKVIDWIDQVKESDEPFMVNYHHKAPHRNWMPGPDHLNAFEGTRFPEPSTLYANWSNELGSPETEDLEIDEW
ncbi:MAG: sulfatase-like hydrolase/transferase, partial [Bacteroidota bacterium]